MSEKRIKQSLLVKDDDGSRATIFQKFLWPLFKNKPDQVTLKRFIEETIFHLSEREIKTYRSKDEFYMLGLLKTTSTTSVQGLGFREVHKGAKLFVRHDTRSPDVYEIEAYIGVGRTETHFLLNHRQFHQILPHLAVVKLAKALV